MSSLLDELRALSYSVVMPLSYSQLNTYRHCPRQYEFQVIKKLPRRISEAESFGSSVHNCLKKWGELEISGQKAVISDQQTMFVEADGGTEHLPLTTNHLINLWHQSFIFNTYPTRVEADFHRQSGEELMRKFYEWWSKEPRHVLAVENSFKILIDGVELSGRMDRIEQWSEISDQRSGVRIIDFKTSRPPDLETSVHTDLQLSIYALAAKELFDQPCRELVLLFLSEERVVECKTTRTEAQLTDAKKQITLLKERMEQKDFHPTPSASVCRRCPYKGVCDVAAV